MSAAIPWGLPWPVPYLAAVSLVLTACLASAFYRAGWLGGPHGIVRVSWLSDGRWIVDWRCGRAAECELCLDSRVIGRAVWLRLRTIDVPRRVYTLLIRRSTAADDPVRRLIVRLRLDVPRSETAARV